MMSESGAIINPTPGSSIHMQISPMSVDLGESFRVDISVIFSGGTNITTPDIQISGLESFRVDSTSDSTRMNIINSSMSAELDRQYILISDHTGTFSIGPATAVIGGQTVSGPVIQVNVHNPGTS